jgi:four helix bundle protein
MSNIAEGFDSRTNRLFIEFLGRAKASGGEVRSQLYVALDQGYIERATCCRLQHEVETASRQIRRLIQYLESVPDQYSRR